MQVVPYRAELAPAFAALNLEWIERLFALEPADLAVLRDPEAAILAPGGALFFVLDGEAAVGTVAALAAGPGRYELAKMAVTPAYQGRGLGEALGRTVIHWARERGAATVFLLTNRRLTGAIRLYQRLGFIERPLPAQTEYRRADVYMELTLPAPGAGDAG